MTTTSKPQCPAYGSRPEPRNIIEHGYTYPSGGYGNGYAICHECGAVARVARRSGFIMAHARAAQPEVLNEWAQAKLDRNRAELDAVASARGAGCASFAAWRANLDLAGMQ